MAEQFILSSMAHCCLLNYYIVKVIKLMLLIAIYSLEYVHFFK